MAHAFPGSLRRSLIATAAVVLLGTVGATCGVVARGPAQTQTASEASEATPVAVAEPAHPGPAPKRPFLAEGVK
jgi:hypothetical protein